MKKIMILIIFLTCAAMTMAQSPQAFRYQAVARDLAGNTLSNQDVSFRIGILQNSATGTEVYAETHNVTTNFFGLVSFDIGNGTPLSGDFSLIQWGEDSYFLRIELDENGGSNYELMGTSQLISVPYALHAQTAEYTTDLWPLQDSVFQLYLEHEADSTFLKDMIDQNMINIFIETMDRIDSDNVLQGHIDAEMIMRQNADLLIHAEMDADSTYFQGLIDMNTDAIADIELKLDADSAFLKGLIDQNASDIAAEISDRITADQNLQDSIYAETARRIAADNMLELEMYADSAYLKGLIDLNATNLAAETTARIDGDLALQDSIDAEEAERMNADLLLAAEMYADSVHFQQEIINLHLELDADSTFLKDLIDQNAQAIIDTAAQIRADIPDLLEGTQNGQMQYWNGTAWVTIAPGSEGQVLTMISGIPTWNTQLSGDDVVNPVTGRTWKNKNLGAAQVATSSTDANAYGDLYQWGRLADGHQLRTSGTTTTLSSTDTPGHSNFILAGTTPGDWRNPQNNNLWQGVGGINNPCPVGYRIPTYAEYNTERLSWISNNAAGAYASPLKFAVAGYRDRSSGLLRNVGSYGSYWSSTISGTEAGYIYFWSSSVSMPFDPRAYGTSIRCIKD